MTRQHLSTIILLASVVAISGCGGDGGVNTAATAPPPVAPSPVPPPSVTPSVTAGTYDTIALVERHSGAPGWALESLDPTTSPDQVQIMVEPSTKTYTVLIDPAISPYTQTVFTPQSPAITTTTPGEAFHNQLLIGPGLSHVSLGAWSGFTISTRSDGTFFSKDDPTFIYFVFGDRTPSADIPVSGTATYTSHIGFSDLNGGNFGIPAEFSLSADFGSRSISALFDVLPALEVGDYEEYYTTGFHATGAAPFTTAGAFEIPLAGALTYKSLDSTIADNVRPMTGAVNGAFFGPQASQVGGVVQFTAEVTPGTFQSVGGNFAGAKD